LNKFQLKKNLFPRSRTQSHSSSGDKDELAVAGSPQKVASGLKTVPEMERTSQSDAKVTQDVTTPEPSFVDAKPGDSKTEDKTANEKLSSLTTAVTATAATTADTERTAAAKALEPVGLAPMAKPESYADSLFQIELDSAAATKPLSNNNQAVNHSKDPGLGQSQAKPEQVSV
jgi:hypothetical protein